MARAGRAVVFSGLTVAIGLLSMIVLPVPFLRSVGYGGVLVPLVSVAVTITLLPGDPGHDRAKAGLAARAVGAAPVAVLLRLGRAGLPHRWASAIIGLAIMGALALPALSLHLGEPGSAGRGHVRPRARRAGHADLRRSAVRDHHARPRCSPQPGGGAPWPRGPRNARRVRGIAPRGLGARRHCAASPCCRSRVVRPAGQAVIASVEHALGGSPGVLGVGGDGASLDRLRPRGLRHVPADADAASRIATFILLARAFRSVAAGRQGRGVQPHLAGRRLRRR